MEHTPSDFPTVSISQSLLETLEKKANDNERKILQIFPANSLQQGFIYHSVTQPDDDAYRVQLLFDYKGLNIEIYKKAWELAIMKYPILRTCFNWEETPIQIIFDNFFAG